MKFSAKLHPAGKQLWQEALSKFPGDDVAARAWFDEHIIHRIEQFTRQRRGRPGRRIDRSACLDSLPCSSPFYIMLLSYPHNSWTNLATCDFLIACLQSATLRSQNFRKAASTVHGDDSGGPSCFFFTGLVAFLLGLLSQCAFSDALRR
jgi:hypothetical protein